MTCTGRSADFKKRVALACYDALEMVGFTRFRKHGVDLRLHDGFHCWVGLNITLRSDDVVEILPFVGLHVIPIARLNVIRIGSKYDRGVATYGVNMGRIDSVACERGFAFSPNQTSTLIDSECERLATLYSTGGASYARSIATYEELLPLLREGAAVLGGYPESVASCLYLMGRKKEAREYVSAFLQQQSDYFRDFAIPFLTKLDEES